MMFPVVFQGCGIFEEIQLEPDQESVATQTVDVEMTDIKRTC